MRNEAMTDTTYDPDADVVVLTVGSGRSVQTRRQGMLLPDVDSTCRIVAFALLSASKVRAPGDWERSRRQRKNARRGPSMPELHRGFLLVRRTSQRDVEPQ